MKEYRVDVFVDTKHFPEVVETLGVWLQPGEFIRFEEFHADAHEAIVSALRKTRGAGVDWAAIRTHHCRPTNPGL